VIVLGDGDVHSDGLQALVTRLLQEELFGDGPAPCNDPARPANPPTDLLARSARTEDTTLSTREREVLEMLARGLRNKEIAEQLYISPSTVNYHLTGIFNKLTVTNRTEAVGVALRRGLITLDADTLLTGHAA
jgi:DNA-binding NarL/FixJ family response regulator